MGTYVPFTLTQFEDFLNESNVPFERIQKPGTMEWIYNIPCVGKSGKTYPAMMQVYSTLQIGEDRTRDVGSDAIRILLLRTDRTDERFPYGIPLKGVEKRAFRTKNAFNTTLNHLRDMFRRAQRQSCPKCSKLMRRIEGKNGAFYGCVDYPTCTATQQVSWVEEGK